MRIAVAVLVMLLVISGDVESRQRKKKSLIVRDYTSSVWDGVIQRTVDDFNAIMPRRGPTLRYERGEDACPRFAPKGVVVYCSMEFIASPGPGFPDPAGIVFNRRTIYLADESVRDDGSVHRANHACHELMHVLTGIPDTERREDVSSCVWGLLPGPGLFDVEQLTLRYAKEKRR